MVFLTNKIESWLLNVLTRKGGSAGASRDNYEYVSLCSNKVRADCQVQDKSVC